MRNSFSLRLKSVLRGSIGLAILASASILLAGVLARGTVFFSQIHSDTKHLPEVNWETIETVSRAVPSQETRTLLESVSVTLVGYSNHFHEMKNRNEFLFVPTPSCFANPLHWKTSSVILVRVPPGSKRPNSCEALKIQGRLSWIGGIDTHFRPLLVAEKFELTKPKN